MKRFAPRLPRLLKFLFLFIFFAIIALFLIYKAALFIQQHPHFHLTEIEINETHYLDREQILQAIDLEKDTSFFTFDVKAAEKNLLEFPWVIDAKVATELPNRLTIHITEREAAAILVSDTQFLVDSLGVPFAYPTANQPKHLPLITGLSSADLENNKDYSRERIMNALALARIYERSELAQTRPLSDIALTASDRYDLHIGKTRVSLGSGDFPVKLARAEAILKHLKDRNLDAEYILLSEDHQRAIVKEKPLSHRSFDALNQER